MDRHDVGMDPLRVAGGMESTAAPKGNEMTNQNETSQNRLNRLMVEAQRRIPVGQTIKNRRGTARWNGLAWVYGK